MIFKNLILSQRSRVLDTDLSLMFHILTKAVTNVIKATLGSLTL